MHFGISIAMFEANLELEIKIAPRFYKTSCLLEDSKRGTGKFNRKRLNEKNHNKFKIFPPVWVVT